MFMKVFIVLIRFTWFDVLVPFSRLVVQLHIL